MSKGKPLTEQQTIARQVTRKNNAARKAALKETERLRQLAGPLFADQVEAVQPVLVTVDQVRRKWRKDKAVGVEDTESLAGYHLLDALMIYQRLHRVVREIVSPEDYQALVRYATATYPSSTYQWSYWQKVLCGERIELAYEKVEDRQPGQPALRVTKSYQCESMTRLEYQTRFSPPPTSQDAPGVKQRVTKPWPA